MKCTVKKCTNQVHSKVKGHYFCKKHFTHLKGINKVKLTKKSVTKGGVVVYESNSNSMIAAYVGLNDGGSSSSSYSESSSSGGSSSSCGSSSSSSCGGGCGGAGCGS